MEMHVASQYNNKLLQKSDNPEDYTLQILNYLFDWNNKSTMHLCISFVPVSRMDL